MKVEAIVKWGLIILAVILVVRWIQQNLLNAQIMQQSVYGPSQLTISPLSQWGPYSGGLVTAGNGPYYGYPLPPRRRRVI